MEKHKKQGFFKRTLIRVLVWRESPFTIFSDISKALFPTKLAKEELVAFRKLTPRQRWEKVKKPDWTADEFARQRNKNCWLAYFFLFCGVMMLAGTWASVDYLNGPQIIGVIAYSGLPFLMFVKKSIAVYAIDKKQIITVEDWLGMPSVWVPVPNNGDV